MQVKSTSKHLQFNVHVSPADQDYFTIYITKDGNAHDFWFKLNTEQHSGSLLKTLLNIHWWLNTKYVILSFIDIHVYCPFINSFNKLLWSWCKTQPRLCAMLKIACHIRQDKIRVMRKRLWKNIEIVTTFRATGEGFDWWGDIWPEPWRMSEWSGDEVDFS